MRCNQQNKIINVQKTYGIPAVELNDLSIVMTSTRNDEHPAHMYTLVKLIRDKTETAWRVEFGEDQVFLRQDTNDFVLEKLYCIKVFQTLTFVRFDYNHF